GRHNQYNLLVRVLVGLKDPPESHWLGSIHHLSCRLCIAIPIARLKSSLDIHLAFPIPPPFTVHRLLQLLHFGRARACFTGAVRHVRDGLDLVLLSQRRLLFLHALPLLLSSMPKRGTGNAVRDAA